MKRTFWIFAIIMAAIISFHGVANATSIIYDGDNVTKVEDLAISGLGMFNVDFIADTFINLFGSNSQFADQATAIIANQALNAALNEEIPIPARIKFEPGTAIANSNVYGVPYGVPYMQGQRINVQSSFNPTNDVPDSGWGIASGPPLTGFIGTCFRS